MRRQYIIFGSGKFGGSIAMTLQELGCDVVVVDRDEEVIQNIADKVTYAVCANVEDTEIFRDLGLHNMDGAVISMTSNMEASIVTTMICKEYGIPQIIAKAKNEMHEKILQRVGADRIIYPELEMGRRVAKHIVADNFHDWIDLSPKYSLVEMEIPGAWVGRNLITLDIRRKYGINVIGIKKEDNVRLNIDPGEPFPSDVILIVVGANEDIKALEI